MSTRRPRFWTRVSGAALAAVALVGAVAPAQAGLWDSANTRFNVVTPAFREVWLASDQVFSNGSIARSFT